MRPPQGTAGRHRVSVGPRRAPAPGRSHLGGGGPRGAMMDVPSIPPSLCPPRGGAGREGRRGGWQPHRDPARRRGFSESPPAACLVPCCSGLGRGCGQVAAAAAAPGARRGSELVRAQTAAASLGDAGGDRRLLSAAAGACDLNRGCVLSTAHSAGRQVGWLED
ncbi:unnamed protein product [Coccothraustes coccothraustes]